MLKRVTSPIAGAKLLQKTVEKASVLIGVQEGSFRQRILKAGLWIVVGFGLNLFVRFGSNLVMTRLLVPDMFGVMAVASTVISGLVMFSDLGLKLNVVQSARGDQPAFLNTAWSIQILRGLLMWAVGTLISAGLIGLKQSGLLASDNVYAAPVLPPVVAVLSFGAVLQGFESTKLFEANRRLSLGLVTRIEILSQIAGVLCMVSWATFDRSVWVLVAGSIGSGLIRTLLSHYWTPGTKNRWHWEKAAAHEILHFGKWIVVASVLGFLVNSGDRLLLGAMVSSSTLGLYSIASLIATVMEGVLTKVMGDVSFPAFSEVFRERRADLKQTYYRFYVPMASLSYFASGVFMASGQSIIDLLYDHRYHDAGWMLQLLGATLLATPFRLATQTFMAMGLPKLQSNIVIARLLILFIGTPVAFLFSGFPGAMIAIVASQFAMIPLIVFYNRKYDLFDLRLELGLLTFLAFGLGGGVLVSMTLQHLGFRH